MISKNMLLAYTTIGLLACSGGAGTAALGEGDAGPGAAQDSGDSQGDGGAPLPVTDGGPDARAVQDGAPDAVSAAASIDPIVVGNKWTYDVTEVGYYPLCPTAKASEAEVVRATPRDGRQAYEVTSFCKPVGSVYYAEEGDVVYWDYSGAWVLVIDAPVADGHTWTNGVTSYGWHGLGSVTVPAGTFSDCWKAQDTLGPTYTVLCRGVGPVIWSYRDAQGNGYDATLTAKNF